MNYAYQLPHRSANTLSVSGHISATHILNSVFLKSALTLKRLLLFIPSVYCADVLERLRLPPNTLLCYYDTSDNLPDPPDDPSVSSIIILFNPLAPHSLLHILPPHGYECIIYDFAFAFPSRDLITLLVQYMSSLPSILSSRCLFLFSPRKFFKLPFFSVCLTPTFSPTAFRSPLSCHVFSFLSILLYPVSFLLFCISSLRCLFVFAIFLNLKSVSISRNINILGCLVIAIRVLQALLNSLLLTVQDIGSFVTIFAKSCVARQSYWLMRHLHFSNLWGFLVLTHAFTTESVYNLAISRRRSATISFLDKTAPLIRRVIPCYPQGLLLHSLVFPISDDSSIQGTLRSSLRVYTWGDHVSPSTSSPNKRSYVCVDLINTLFVYRMLP
jgi:hypothetical protein